MPVYATTITSAAVFEPVTAVIVVDVVFDIKALRTQHAILFADADQRQTPTNDQPTPSALLSVMVGTNSVLPLIEAKQISKSPTAGVIATVRLPVPEVPPPAALVR